MNTAQDVVDYLLAGIGGGAQDGEHRAVRQAVVHGVREVMQCKQWLWHTKNNSFDTQNVTATVASGGIALGSAIVTLTNASQMVPGRLVQLGNYFPEPTRILSVGSGNTIVLDKTALASLPAGQSQTLTMQTYYDLPADLKDIDSLMTHTVGTLHAYISPMEWQRRQIYTQGSGEPYYYTIMRSDTNPEVYQIRFVGVPTNGTTVHYTYRYSPKAIKYMGYELLCRQGTVSSAGTTVTGADTDFPSDVAGSVIRFGTTATDADPIGSLSPYLHERQITARSSATSLTIKGSLTVPALTKYAISDPIDASPQMYTAILSACEMWYARIAGKPVEQAMGVYGRDLRIAMENDQVAPLSGRPLTDYHPTPRSMGWRSAPLMDLE